jgi:DNA invertase Pin-like site-specific DNA recombinase
MLYIGTRLWHTVPMTRCALYARVSTKDKGQDTENQLAQLRQFCAASNWTIVGEFIDHISAKSGDRTSFKALFTAASQRRFDVVLFWSLDRFSREGVRETLNYLTTLESYGVNFRSFTEQYLDSCGIFKDAVLSILATIAKQERIRLSERTKAGLEQAARRGRKGGRPRRVFDRQQARDMRDSGASWREISAELGVPFTTIRTILTKQATA